MTNRPSKASAATTEPDVQQQAGKFLAQFAGYVGFKTIKMGLDNGLIQTLADNPDGLIAEQLAAQAGTDVFYTEVWARAAYGAEVIEVDAKSRYTLAAHVEDLILNTDFPGYIGGIVGVFSEPEIFDNFSANLKSGKRVWWDETSPRFIEGVSGTGRPFYNRLIPPGLQKVPGLVANLKQGGRVLELAAGAGIGLVKFAETFPNTQLTGVDGDINSVEIATERVQFEGVSDRVSLVHSTLEDYVEKDAFDLAFINISMHECRDIDQVTRNVKSSLKAGGVFVISDFPFPATHEGLRTIPARVMSGIQYFEAQIDDQLVPTQVFVDLLERHYFEDVKAFDLTPVHNLIFGRK